VIRLSPSPPTGGTIRTTPEDFVVEEIPAYEPSGRGGHLLVWIEKRLLTTDQAKRRIASALSIDPSEVGSAGMKDRVAVTRQQISVPGTPSIPPLGEDLRILSATPHDAKLRTGHLRGNRFTIAVRATSLPPQEALESARRTLEHLASCGLANLFGPQRFGRDGETARLGMGMLARGQPPPRSRSLRRLALSAAQSLLYNEYLESRIADGLFRRVLPGDVLKKTGTGGLFNADPATLELDQGRLDSGEIVHAGPIFGRKTFRALDEAAAREQAVLDAHGLTPEHLSRHGKLLQGTRRPDIVYPRDATAAPLEDGFVLAFTLPPGSYATVLLNEITGTVSEP
jgi:tRNA pseudouridine13 synthase